MQSKIQDFVIDLNVSEIRKEQLKGFELYEEFSGTNIYELIKNRMESFDKSNEETRRQLEATAEKEVNSFCTWLTEIKGMSPDIAHYYAVSLKSLLVGLPNGVDIGLLFGGVLDTVTRK